MLNTPQFRITAAGLLLCGLMAGPAMAENTLEETRPLKHDARLSISNVAGEVLVRGWDKEQMELQAVTGRAFEELKITGDANDLRIEVKIPKDARNVDGTDLRLSVPHSVKLYVSAVSADVITNELSGPQELKTVSGDATVNGHSQKLRIKTVSGDIQLTAPSESTELGSVSGDINAEGLLGKLSAETVSGSIRTQVLKATEIRAKAVSGDLDLRLELQADADVRAESLSGDINLWLPKDSDTRIEMSTFSGDLDTELGPGVRGDRKSHEFTLGKGNGRVQLSTFSGDAELHQQ